MNPEPLLHCSYLSALYYSGVHPPTPYTPWVSVLLWLLVHAHGRFLSGVNTILFVGFKIKDFQNQKPEVEWPIEIIMMGFNF